MTSRQTTTTNENLVLDLETLTKKYQNLLIEYQQAVTNYIEYIKTGSTVDSSGEPFVTVKGSTYWGTSGISQSTNTTTLNDCTAACSKTSGCTGATFNAADYNEPKCWLRGGTSGVTAGKDGDYAIINKGQYLLSIVESINTRLVSINDQIAKKTSEGQPLYDAQVEETANQNKALIQQYHTLSADRAKITEMMNEYQTIDEQQKQGNIKITQNYYSYILLFALAILIIFMTFKVSFLSSGPILQPGGDLGKSAYYIVGVLVFLSIFTLMIYLLSKK